MSQKRTVSFAMFLLSAAFAGASLFLVAPVSAQQRQVRPTKISAPRNEHLR